MNFFIAISFKDENYKKYGQAIFSCNAKKSLLDVCFGGPYVFGPFWIATITGLKQKPSKYFCPG